MPLTACALRIQLAHTLNEDTFMTTPDWDSARAQFPTLQKKIYLNSCSLGLLSRRSRDALNKYMDLWEEKGAAAWYVEWFAEMEDLREQFARLINASADEIAIMPSISATLAAISSSIDLQEGDQLVTGELDFPTVAHGFHAKARSGVETTVVRSDDRVMVSPEQFEQAISERTRLVATSRVYFTSGYIQDISTICDAAHNAGAIAFVDDYQATGQVPIDVQEVEADVLVSGGLKWLLGGPGITYMYVRRDLIPELEPSITGWFGHRDQFAFNPHEMVYKDSAGRFETGTPSVSAMYTGAEGLRIVNELGADAIRRRTSELTSRLVSSLRERGFDLRVPLDDEHHASITMIELDNPGPVVDRLAERDIIVDFRPGALRASPYFYNTQEDIDIFVDALTELTRK